MPNKNIVVFTVRTEDKSQQYRNMLIGRHDSHDILFDFEGKSINGVAKIVSTRKSECNEKPIYIEYTVELASGIIGFVWHKSNDTGSWLGGEWHTNNDTGSWLGDSWEETIQRINNALDGKWESVQHLAVERYVRITFDKDTIKDLDEDILNKPSELPNILTNQTAMQSRLFE